MKLICTFAMLLCLTEALKSQGHNTLQRKNLIPTMRNKITSPRIVNGLVAQKYQFKYMVGLLIHDGRGKFMWCGGALISNQRVITAAHCLYRQNSALVFLGSVIRLEGEVRYNVPKQNMILNFAYNHEAYENDIALIRIPPVSYSQAIYPIALPRLGFPLGIGSMATTMGWGDNSTHGSPSHTLLFANVRVISNRDCRRFYESPYIDDKKVCTESVGNSGPCDGDSGGPLVLRSQQVLIGIAVFHHTNGCLAGAPDGFTRITAYLNWIRDKTGIRT